jgi:hypothetical protein
MLSARGAVFASLLLPALAGAAVYTCADAQGRTIIRDAPCTRAEQRGGQVDLREEAGRKLAAEAPGRVRRKEVEQLLARLDRAMARRDLGSVVALYAPDARLEVSAGGGKALARMDRDGFARWLDERFAGSGYAHRPTPARIALPAKQARANVTRGLRESVPGSTAQRVVRERITFEPVEGQLLITRWRRDLPAP